MSAFLEEGDAVSHGMWRRVFEAVVTWQPDYIFHDDSIVEWDYCVGKFPFVPGFHVCHIDDDGDEHILSTHKTLHEAMDIVKILLASGGVRHE